LTPQDWQSLASSLPVVELGADDLDADLVDLLAAHRVVASKSEARRLIAQGGLYLNDIAVPEGRTLLATDLFDATFALVRRGKKHRYLLRVT
jgi:tyrosyl-tRNA synthetase